ncbi:MAG: hypothetical protein ACRDV1_10050 [Actinomycetes bacterium]
MSSTTSWFEAAVRPEDVGPRLIDAVGELSADGAALVGCRVIRLRSSSPEGHWSATYLLDVCGPEPGRRRTIVAYGVLTPPGLPLPRAAAALPFGADGWQVVLPELRLHLRTEATDEGLPALSLLSDPEDARCLLEGALRAGTARYADIRLDWAKPVMVSHKPGVRATSVCRLGVVGGPADLAVVIKVHSDDQGLHADRVLRALCASPLGSSRRVILAESLGYLSDMRMSVQAHVEHRATLKDLVHQGFDDATDQAWPQLLATTRTTAAGLAELHGCGVDLGPAVTFEDELAALMRKRDKLAAVLPWLPEDRRAVLERLGSAARAMAEDPLGPAHHSFRPAQVLVVGDRVAFIDLDKFCQAEPASDLAVFTTKIRHMAVNKARASQTGEGVPVVNGTRIVRMRAADEVRAAFLSEYEQHATVSRDRIVLWEAMELFSLVLSAGKKAQHAWVESCLFMLEHHLQAHDL